VLNGYKILFSIRFLRKNLGFLTVRRIEPPCLVPAGAQFPNECDLNRAIPCSATFDVDAVIRDLLCRDGSRDSGGLPGPVQNEGNARSKATTPPIRQGEPSPRRLDVPANTDGVLHGRQTSPHRTPGKSRRTLVAFGIGIAGATGR
jgi:hypothetical protein